MPPTGSKIYPTPSKGDCQTFDLLAHREGIPQFSSPIKTRKRQWARCGRKYDKLGFTTRSVSLTALPEMSWVKRNEARRKAQHGKSLTDEARDYCELQM
jgi:hypothetical protein